MVRLNVRFVFFHVGFVRIAQYTRFVRFVVSFVFVRFARFNRCLINSIRSIRLIRSIHLWLGSSRRCSAHANQERRSRGAYVQPILLNATAHLQTMRVYIGCGSIMVHGFLADGFLADGFLADGFLVDDFLADGFFVDRSRFSC